MSSRRIALRFRADRIDLAARQTLSGIHRHAAEAGWRCTFDHAAGDAEPVPYDGIIAPANYPLALRLKELGVPQVHVGLQSRKGTPAPQVAEHRHAAGALAARHLMDREYRRFLYLGYERHGPAARQDREFRRVLNARGHGVDSVVLMRGHKDRLTARSGLRRILAEWFREYTPPMGLFVMNPPFARVAAEVAMAEGLRVPDDMGIVSAGDDPLYCEAHDCPLTAIDLCFEAVGLRAAQLLDRLLDGDVPPIRTIYIPPRTVPRRSTDHRFLDDPAVADALAFISLQLSNW
ncbi:substrate-binding domain-containing protein, partial [Planctomycetota bacterium]